ncbi:MAG: hypothetical protein ACRDSZ_03810 [Pseudonocardiaceae bacterium]
MVGMSLVVAQIHDGGISLVADTKITYGLTEIDNRFDESRTRRVFRNALPKLTILRDDLVVGVVDEVKKAQPKLVNIRDQRVENILKELANIDYASFVVAALNPLLQLWKVSAGSIEEQSSVGRCWAGDRDAYEFFQQKYHEWPEGIGSTFRLMSSMQWLLNFNPVESVGGYLTMVATTSEGFRFIANRATIGPWVS